MLVPSAADKNNTSNLLWVPSRGSGRGRKDGTPVVQQHASAVARAAEGVAPGVRTAQAALDQHQVQTVDPARRAAAQARSHVGAARAQLREVLAQQAGTFPPPLSPQRDVTASTRCMITPAAVPSATGVRRAHRRGRPDGRRGGERCRESMEQGMQRVTVRPAARPERLPLRGATAGR